MVLSRGGKTKDGAVQVEWQAWVWAWVQALVVTAALRSLEELAAMVVMLPARYRSMAMMAALATLRWHSCKQP